MGNQKGMSIELLTRAIEEIMANRYGNTVTVRIVNVTSKNKEDESSRCSETN